MIIDRYPPAGRLNAMTSRKNIAYRECRFEEHGRYLRSAPWGMNMDAGASGWPAEYVRELVLVHWSGHLFQCGNTRREPRKPVFVRFSVTALTRLHPRFRVTNLPATAGGENQLKGKS